MLDLSVLLSNADLDALEAFAEEQIKVQADRMVSGTPNKRTEKATTVFMFLTSVKRQINEHRALVAEKERAAREARKGKRGQ